jgi:hypothetical protein
MLAIKWAIGWSKIKLQILGSKAPPIPILAAGKIVTMVPMGSLSTISTTTTTMGKARRTATTGTRASADLAFLSPLCHQERGHNLSDFNG